ncbi:uncharacterized protein LOC117659700 isoform X1 [Pantherophis guttatus]|uniref:Uncharacterized protein LOC117659700 isoform X1 n=1 Tax=Pantherophis guttatus TaxID=94885 RepID=A0A6P9AXQ4_PANGU|nr:uncharacterized protein LOC117659700 isoform X1 [Pantherophis guttatus]
MESAQRIQTAARKENIPPALNCYGAPKEQRKIQKNINIHLLLSSGSHLGELWTQTSSSIHGSNLLGENIERGLRVPSGRRQTSGLFQTNLFCPPGGLAKASLVQQQTNLEKRRRWEGGTLKRTPRRGFPERPRDIPRNSSGMKNREQYLLKGPRELFTGSRRSYEDLKAKRKSSSPSQFSLDPSLHSLRMIFSGISDSSPPGPALTLDSLVDGHSSPEGSRTFIRSSQSSADRCWSLHGLKKKRSSFSCESWSPSWVPQPACEPQSSTLAMRKAQSSVERNSSGQLRSKWPTMLSSILLTCQEDDSSCLRSSSGTPPTTNKMDELRDQGYLRTLGPEERPSGTFCGSELYLKNLPPDVFSLRSLESSLKTLCAESSPRRRLSMDDTHEEEPPTLDPSGVPEVPLGHPFEKNVGDFATREVGDKHGEAGGDPTITSSVDEASLLTALQKVPLFEETIWKGPRKGSRPINTTVWPRHLQKDGGPLRGYFVPLEIKKLDNVFKRWRSRWEKRQQIRLLVFRIQTRLIERCFKAWQSLAQQKRHSQVAMEHLWAQSLRASFQQWCLMVEARRNAKMAVIELLGTKRPSSCGPRRDPDRRPWPPKYVENTLDSLFHLRTLQEAFLTWEARCREAQRAGAFRHSLTLRQLREALGRWRRRTRGLNPLGLTEGSLLASADLQESSSSSALPTACQAVQPVEPSLIGLTSLGTVEEPSGRPAPASHCPNCSYDCENPTHVAKRASPLRLDWQAASKYGRLWKRIVQLHRFQGVWEAHQLAKAWLLWRDACRTELVVQTLRWRREARWSWKIWRRRWLQLQVAQRFHKAEEEQLLKTAFGKWRRLAAISRVQNR